jgi:hypothetical protein
MREALEPYTASCRDTILLMARKMITPNYVSGGKDGHGNMNGYSTCYLLVVCLGPFLRIDCFLTFGQAVRPDSRLSKQMTELAFFRQYIV